MYLVKPGREVDHSRSTLSLLIRGHIVYPWYVIRVVKQNSAISLDVPYKVYT